MTADRHPHNDGLQRAILADGIARLEKQLDAAEKRARDAESSAREAKSALAEVLLDKARNQKSAPESDKDNTAPVVREIQSLRAELDLARRDLQQQEAKLQDVRDDAAQELRVEYERRFNAARERMAQELQRRLSDAPTALTLDAKPREAMATSDAPAGDALSQHPAAARLRIIGTRALDSMARPRFMIPLAAFVGGLLVGWTMLPGKSDPMTVAAKDAPQAAESPAIAQAPAPDAEPAPAAVPPPAITEAPAAAHPPANVETLAAPPPAIVETPPAAVAQPLLPVMPSENSEAPASSQVMPLEPAGDRRALQERNAALTLQVDELRALLGTASRRAKTAEAALSDERKKTADLTRRAAAPEPRRDDRAGPDEAAAANPSVRPAVSAERVRRTTLPFPTVE